MAVVKNSYIKPSGHDRKQAKAAIRYIQNRTGKEGVKARRDLFGRDGVMDKIDAYRMIDDADKGSVFFRFIISPDPAAEDTKWDISLSSITEHTMLGVEERLNRSVEWVAAEHADHTPYRHVHILAVLPRLAYQDFQALPRLMRTAATQACWQQRQERDRLYQSVEHHREEAQWEQSY
jgi:hypothetical protein